MNFPRMSVKPYDPPRPCPSYWFYPLQPLTTSHFPSIRTVLPQPLPLAPQEFFSTPIPPSPYNFSRPGILSQYAPSRAEYVEAELRIHHRGPSPMNTRPPNTQSRAYSPAAPLLLFPGPAQPQCAFSPRTRPSLPYYYPSASCCFSKISASQISNLKFTFPTILPLRKMSSILRQPR